MSDQYRLVFSGEINEGQHAAVVKKRLTALLKLDDARMDVLFSGKAVVVKKSTDKTTAVRYQEAFAKAGARLRVLPVEGDTLAEDQPAAPGPASPADSRAGVPVTADEARSPVSPDSSDSADTPDTPDTPDAQAGGLQLLPVGADILTEAERPQPQVKEVPTSHLSLSSASAASAPSAEPLPAQPQVDHLTLAELGTQLGTPAAREVVVAEIDAHFDLAEVGAILGAMEDKAVPPAPDTGHLSLQEDNRADPADTQP